MSLGSCSEGAVERHGSRDDRRWLRFIDAEHAFEAGKWKEALSTIQDFNDEFMAGVPFGLAAPCFALRTLWSLARGDIAAAERDAREATKLRSPATPTRARAERGLNLAALPRSRRARDRHRHHHAPDVSWWVARGLSWESRRGCPLPG